MNQKRPNIDETTELVLVMDSNARYIDFKKLWTIRTTDIQRKGTMKEVNGILDNKVYKYLKYLFFSVGCNDIEYNSGAHVFDEIKKTVERIQSQYPNVKVILSEITPRMDCADLDKEVKDCNELLNNYVNESDKTYIVRNSNLRDRKFFLSDGKHLSKNTIGRFASNIKWALRRAYGIRWTNNYSSHSTIHTNNIQRYTTNPYRGIQRDWHGERTQSFDPQKLWNPTPMPSQ